MPPKASRLIGITRAYSCCGERLRLVARPFLDTLPTCDLGGVWLKGGASRRTELLPTISPFAIDLRAPLSPRALKRARYGGASLGLPQVGPARALLKVHHRWITPEYRVVRVSGKVKISPPTMLKHHRDNP